jgi:hypothetical protein
VKPSRLAVLGRRGFRSHRRRRGPWACDSGWTGSQLHGSRACYQWPRESRLLVWMRSEHTTLAARVPIHRNVLIDAGARHPAPCSLGSAWSMAPLELGNGRSLPVTLSTSSRGEKNCLQRFVLPLVGTVQSLSLCVCASSRHGWS